MQCTGNSGYFPQGKRAATVLRHHPAFLPPCAHCSCFQSIGYEAYSFLSFFFLRQMDMGSLTCAQIWVSAVHTKRGGGGEGIRHNQVCTRVVDPDRQKKLPYVSPCPARGSNPKVFGVEFRLSTHWATCVPPPPITPPPPLPSDFGVGPSSQAADNP